MDRPIEGAIHESLRLYVLCKGMRWTHLPVAGGLYDQHPQFLDDLTKIMSSEAEADKIKRAREMREQKNIKPKPSGRGGSRMRRR